MSIINLNHQFESTGTRFKVFPQSRHCDKEKFYALQPGQLPTQKWQIVTVATDRQIGSPPVKIRSKMEPQFCITIAPALGPTGWGKYVRLMPCMPDNLYQLWRIIY
ncbi:MAG: hypothetical protein HC877_13215 [Thioploca sp.]|nr:hypothetical protein [Thioploca sp.]